MTTKPDQLRRTRRAAVIIGGVVPLVIAAVATAVMVSWLPQLPSPVATHWGATGGPDGYGSAWTTLVLPLIFCTAFGAIAVGASWGTRPSGLLGGTQKLLLVTNLFLSGLLSSLALGTFAIQRGLSDASKAPSLTPIALSAAAIGIVLAVIGWFLLPRTDNSVVDVSTPEPIELAPTERAAWSSSIRVPWGFLVLLGGVVVVLCVALIVPLSTTSPGPVIPIVIVVFVVLVAVGTSFWRVSVDYRGLVARSVLGWPRISIRPGDIRSVHVVQINPVADFGGWGWRWTGGRRVGIIMRAGEAIEVVRKSGSVFVVTVDDAETAVSVLAALVAQNQDGAHATGS